MTSQAQGKPGPGLDLSAYRELFLREAVVSLAALRQNLTRLAGDPASKRAWQEAHRAAHTLKGMASTMHYEELTNLAKQLESPFLSDPPLAPDQIESLLKDCDRFDFGLGQLERDSDHNTTRTDAGP